LLGQILQVGLGNRDAEEEFDDIEEAIELYRSAAEKGHAGAMYQLACCFESGLGVVLDYSKALQLFEEVKKTRFLYCLSC
jgi:TPR repeat protein